MHLHIILSFIKAEMESSRKRKASMSDDYNQPPSISRRRSNSDTENENSDKSSVSSDKRSSATSDSDKSSVSSDQRSSAPSDSEDQDNDSDRNWSTDSTVMRRSSSPSSPRGVWYYGGKANYLKIGKVFIYPQ